MLSTAIAGYPDPPLGERACAFVVLRPGQTLDGAGVDIGGTPYRFMIAEHLGQGLASSVTATRKAIIAGDRIVDDGLRRHPRPLALDRFDIGNRLGVRRDPGFLVSGNDVGGQPLLVISPEGAPTVLAPGVAGHPSR